MFQSSVWICSLGESRILLSSADRALWRRLTCLRVFVGEAWVEWLDWELSSGGGYLTRIFWSAPPIGRSTLFRATFGAELDLFSKLSVLGLGLKNLIFNSLKRIVRIILTYGNQSSRNMKSCLCSPTASDNTCPFEAYCIILALFGHIADGTDNCIGCSKIPWTTTVDNIHRKPERRMFSLWIDEKTRNMSESCSTRERLSRRNLEC